MDTLFSCRNCVHNAGQTLNIGRGSGYCLLHKSILRSPEQLTCKYLTRKDMPSFTVDEGVKEHAYEFATYSSIVDTTTMRLAQRLHYSEKHAWVTHNFDALTMTLSNSDKVEPKRLFIESLAGGVDGRRALAHASVIRRYMANCGTWTSSYRLVLSMVQGLQDVPFFSARDLETSETDTSDAVWDLFFVRISGVQEYGFHAGIEQLIWATDQLGESFIDLDWSGTYKEIVSLSDAWVETIIAHARDEGQFFPEPPPEDRYT